MIEFQRNLSDTSGWGITQPGLQLTPSRLPFARFSRRFIGRLVTRMVLILSGVLVGLLIRLFFVLLLWVLIFWHVRPPRRAVRHRRNKPDIGLFRESPSPSPKLPAKGTVGSVASKSVTPATFGNASEEQAVKGCDLHPAAAITVADAAVGRESNTFSYIQPGAEPRLAANNHSDIGPVLVNVGYPTLRFPHHKKNIRIIAPVSFRRGLRLRHTGETHQNNGQVAEFTQDSSFLPKTKMPAAQQRNTMSFPVHEAGSYDGCWLTEMSRTLPPASNVMRLDGAVKGFGFDHKGGDFSHIMFGDGKFTVDQVHAGLATLEGSE